MKPPQAIRPLCVAFLDGLKEVLGEKLFAVYLYGAVAFPETTHIGDIDFHVILTEELTEGEKTGLEALFASLARDFPPLGAEMDGYFILLEDAHLTRPPIHQLYANKFDDAWALHREHIRAGAYIALHGPDPLQVYPPASWLELEVALVGELQYVYKHLDIYPDYCVLNLCRLMYSFETRDVVVSKAAAAQWAAGIFSQWTGLIEAATRSYARQATASDMQLMKSRLPQFYAFARDRISRSLDSRSSGGFSGIGT